MNTTNTQQRNVGYYTIADALIASTTEETSGQAFYKFVKITKCKETEMLEEVICDFFNDFQELPECRINKLIEETEEKLVNVMEWER